MPSVCVSDGVFEQPLTTVKGFHCMKNDISVGEGGYNDFPSAIYGAISDGHGCSDWEIMEDYFGSRTFAERQRSLEGGQSNVFVEGATPGMVPRH